MIVNKKDTILSCIAASILLLIFCFVFMRHITINADVLLPFSFAKDVLTHVPLNTWYFPAPTFIFPDILVSIPLVFLSGNILIWFYSFALLQIFALNFILYWLLKKIHKNVSFALVVYVTIFTFLIGYFFLKHVFIPFGTKIFYPVHHMSAAIIALASYLSILPAAKLNRIKFSLLISIFFLASYSDLFFFLYFFAFIAATIFIYAKSIFVYERWFVMLGLLLFVGLAGIGLNFFTNPNFITQFHNSYDARPFLMNLEHFIIVIKGQGFIVFIIIPLLLLLYKVENAKKNLTVCSIALGLLFITFGVATTGMIKDINSLRYLGIYFLSFVYIIVVLLPANIYRLAINKKTSIMIVILSLTSAYWKIPFNTPEIYTSDIKTIRQCNTFKQHRTHAIVIASYWPAKVLFEAENRVFSLIQVTPDVKNIYPWIYNTSWGKLNKPFKKNPPEDIIIITKELDSDKLNALLAFPFAQKICNNNAILLSP